MKPREIQGIVMTCSNCGRRGLLIWFDGHWWCPGACRLPKKPGARPESEEG
jgi:hypothetical protein